MPTTPPEFSVLLLAWDDADPTVAVLGGAVLPPTLPLVYQLAAQHPVLAVYPHLPVDEHAAPTSAAVDAEPAIAGAAPATAQAAVDALATAVDGPGVHVLPATAAAGGEAAGPSRIIGLSELEPTAAPEPAAFAATTTRRAEAPLRPQFPAAARSQWPTGHNAPTGGPWQTPAAPYLGAGSGGFFPPPPPRPASVGTRATPVAAAAAGELNGIAPVATAPSATPTATLRPQRNPQAGDLPFDPDPELPAMQQPAVFEEITEEVGAGEAADISAPEDNIVPDAPAGTTTEASPVALAPEPATAEPMAPLVLTPRLDGLNARMIQYARQAAHLVRGRSDFGVIYAPNWPAWLAALEIRNSSRRPLVLYAASLATDLPNPAEHGYQLEMERMTMRKARLILVPTDALRHRLLALYEDTASKVRVVPADDEAAVQRILSEVALG